MKPVVGPIFNLKTNKIHYLKSREELGLRSIAYNKKINDEYFYLFVDPNNQLWAQPISVFNKYFSKIEHRNQKLSVDEVMEIYLYGYLYSVKDLSKIYNVSMSCIRKILNRKSWKKITQGYSEYE